MFSWDPVAGAGLDGPYIVLCHRHRHYNQERGIRTGRRFHVVNGWLGAANKYGYGASVFESETGSTPAPEWWACRRPSRAGGPFRRDAA